MSDAQGREALSVIHINVPRTAKARWVKASQARGMKLTDWIIEQLENRAMKVRPIPVALRYFEDAAPELGDVLAEGGSAARRAVQARIVSDAAGPTVRELQALGDVSVGMCSAWEFVE